MIGVFEFLILIILIFLMVVYAIYKDIKTDLKLGVNVLQKGNTGDTSSKGDTGDISSKGDTGGSSSTSSTSISSISSSKGNTGDCKRKCTKPTKLDGTCYHPIKYNDYLKTNQKVKSQLICPWSCSSGYSDDPLTCQYDRDCAGCEPVSFPSIDESCPKSTYGCCGNKTTEKTDEFGNNCLGLTGGAGVVESFSIYESVEDNSNKEQNVYILNPPQIYPACPNISCPNENAFTQLKV